MGLQHYLILSALLFSLGLYGVLTRKNAIGVLMAVELMFNSVNLNLMAFAHYMMDTAGLAFCIFVITVAAAEVTVGVALVLSVYRNRNLIDLDQVAELNG
ncbi:MAG: NADH-quinone oxidoreductase subunit NuoK [Candidatus Eremiobacteraeota bacterium]|nr:NADH-quinone oxidoreductase subunit NuoK [Candidatus Eremiobacteraeota bacterium]